MDVGAVSAGGGAGDQRVLRFGQFELDLRTRELRRGGVLVKLQQQPFKVLALLVVHAGDLVTREELRQQIWGGDTYVDFDQGLNFCIKQIRTALGDQADTPRYVETLPRRGYRFIAPVEAQPAPPQPQNGGPGAAAAPALPPAAAEAEPPVREVEPRRAARVRTAWVAGIAATAAVALAGFEAGRVSGTAGPEPAFHRLTFRRGLLDAARFTAAGEVLYTAAWDGLRPELFATRLGAADTRALGSQAMGVRLMATAGSEAAIRYLGPENRFMLARLPMAGGPLRDVAEDVPFADWSADGRVFAAFRAERERGLRLEMPLGHPLAKVDGTVNWLRLSPRGDRVAFLEHPMPADDRGSVATIDAQGRRRVLSSDWASVEGLAWSPSGKEVWFTGTRLGADSALWAVDLEGRERLVYRGPGRLVLQDIGPDGRALLTRNALRIEVRARAAGDAEERDASWFDMPFLADITPDGEGVVFVESGEAGGPGYGIFLRRGTAPPVRLGEGRPLALSPDGKWLASLPLAPPYHVALIPTGAGEPRTIREEGLQNIYEAAWLPDGSGLVLAARQPGRPQRLFLQPLSGGAPRPVTPEGVTTRQVVVSPDGRWTVAVPPDAAPTLYPLGGGEPRPLAGAEPGDQPLQWGADGATLFVQRGRLPMQVYSIELAGGTRRLWRELAPRDRAGVPALSRICLTRDARGYAYGYGRVLSELYLVEGLR